MGKPVDGAVGRSRSFRHGCENVYYYYTRRRGPPFMAEDQGPTFAAVATIPVPAILWGLASLDPSHTLAR